MVAYRFEDAEWDQTRTGGPKRNQPLADIRFRQLLTETQWAALPPPVRNRFGRRVRTGGAIVYRGHVEYNRVNRWGRLLNTALKLIGAPLPLDTQNAGAAAIVTVTEAPGENGTHGGQIWMRQYARQDTKRPFPQIIQSAKRFTGPTGIEEHIGGGIGMSLQPAVEGNELVFYAQDIFWDVQGPWNFRLTLPRWLGPKTLRAGHEELGGGEFVFTLRLHHKWFGKMLDQRVCFQDDVEARIRYRRTLDPAWYFGPMQRRAISESADYLLTHIIGKAAA